MPKIAGKTYIEPNKVLDAIRAAGLKAEELSSFYKVQGDGSRRLYVPMTKGVGRIDLSGFEMPAGTPGIVQLGDKSFGGVKQQMEFEGRSEAEVLRTLGSVIKALKGERARAPRPAAHRTTRTSRTANA